MIRKLLLLVAAFLALSGPAGACPFVVPVPPPSDYEAVDAATRIVLARPVDMEGDEVRFAVEEVLKGRSGKALRLQGSFQQTGKARDPWCNFNVDCYLENSLYLLFLDPEEGARVEEPEEGWIETLRLFAEVSALDDEEREKEALRQLRQAAAEDREGRYPAGLARRIDLHFALPSPAKPFSDLMDLYYAAETDGERLEVLWALVGGNHPETAGFFRGLLFEGEPAWLLRPVAIWFEDRKEELPRIEDLARIYLAYTPGERKSLLDLILESATEQDHPLLWSLLPGSDRAEVQSLVDVVLLFPEVAPSLSIPPDERLKTDLIAVWVAGHLEERSERLQQLLRGDGRWRSAKSPQELAELFETATDPAERRQILVELFGRRPDLPVVWRLLRRAGGWEADLLLAWVSANELSREELVGLYRSARTAEEKERALWVVGAAWQGEELLGTLLPEAGTLGKGASRLEPVARAFLSCPNGDARWGLAIGLVESLATAQDRPVMVELLEGAAVEDVWMLAPWFAQHPTPEALPSLRRASRHPLEQDFQMAAALAAAGDPEVLELALEILTRPGKEDDPWAIEVIAISPLPATERNASSWREWYLQEIANSETVDEVTRERALASLARFSKSEASPEP